MVRRREKKYSFLCLTLYFAAYTAVWQANAAQDKQDYDTRSLILPVSQPVSYKWQLTVCNAILSWSCMPCMRCIVSLFVTLLCSDWGDLCMKHVHSDPQSLPTTHQQSVSSGRWNWKTWKPRLCVCVCVSDMSHDYSNCDRNAVIKNVFWSGGYDKYTDTDGSGFLTLTMHHGLHIRII